MNYHKMLLLWRVTAMIASVRQLVRQYQSWLTEPNYKESLIQSSKPMDKGHVANRLRGTVCVKDCGLHSQKNWYDNFFACFIGKLDSSNVEI